MARRLWHLVRHGLARFRWPLAGLAALAVVLACVLVIPQWLVRWELGDVARTLTAADRAKAINDVRTTLLQGIGGAVLLLGAYFTYRQLQTGREQVEVARQQARATTKQASKQLAITEQGQVTERFTRAIDQLGHAELDVRLGGIYALERIANDSPDDRTTIAEVLTAFVRGHGPWPPTRPGQYLAEAPIEQVPELQVRAPDVQAALTVLARRQPSPKPSGPLDLHATDLRKAALNNATLQGAILNDAQLAGASLEGAQLQGAHLFNAVLSEANLNCAQLQEATLVWAELQGAVLTHAQLEKIGATNAQLQGAQLDDAQLQGAYLAHAVLSRATLNGAQLQGVVLASADLREADLSRAQLQGSNLSDAQLQGSNLSDAQLQRVNLEGGLLQEATLIRAQLQGAVLVGTKLEGAALTAADFAGAQLQGADLALAQLNEAIFSSPAFGRARADADTSWPYGFDWKAAGVERMG